MSSLAVSASATDLAAASAPTRDGRRLTKQQWLDEKHSKGRSFSREDPEPSVQAYAHPNAFLRFKLLEA